MQQPHWHFERLALKAKLAQNHYLHQQQKKDHKFKVGTKYIAVYIWLHTRGHAHAAHVRQPETQTPARLPVRRVPVNAASPRVSGGFAASVLLRGTFFSCALAGCQALPDVSDLASYRCTENHNGI